jgi:hypothetical protein
MNRARVQMIASDGKSYMWRAQCYRRGGYIKCFYAWDWQTAMDLANGWVRM